MGVDFDFFKRSQRINALIAYPNKVIKIEKVPIEEGRFTKGKKTYVVDEKAVYFWKNKPFLFYNHNDASPKILQSTGFENSMTSSEMRAVVEMDAVQDLLTANSGEEKWTLYASAAAAIFSLVLILIEFGVIHVAKPT